MSAKVKRSRTPRTVERSFVQARQESQLVGAAYQLVVPLIRRKLAAARPGLGLSGARDAGKGQAHRAAGGSSS